VIFALCAIRASQSILNRDAEAGYSLTHNLCKQPPAFRSLKFLHCSSALRQCVSLANCRSQTLLTLGFPKLRKHSLRTKFESSANSCAAFYIGKLSPKQDASNLGPIDPALLPAFEAAFLQKQMLGFQYCDANGHHTNREVEPQAMLVLPPLWYLVAWDPARDNFRHFRMDRISAPAPIRNTSFRQRYVPFEDHICPFKDVHGN
jgi:hypothetical protein